MNREQLSLYLVTDRKLAGEKPLETIVKNAVKGGVTMVQLREKTIDTGEFITIAKRLKDILDRYHIPLIINDRIDVALAVDADGVHIGQSDMDYDIARKLLGKDKIIGLSIENFAQLEKANEIDVDYVAASPVFETNTKTDAAKPWGLDGLKEFVKKSKHPVVAIGGINQRTAQDVTDCKVDGIAVVSAIITDENPENAASQLRKLSPYRSDCSIKDNCCKRKPVSEIGEFGLIEIIKGRISSSKEYKGIGDDCAIITQNTDRETLVSTDLLIEDIHFIKRLIKPSDLGWKSAAVNLSDIAAMGGKPVATFLSIALPPDTEIKWVEEFIDGFENCCRKYGAYLLGGDTTSSKDRICINVTVLGECANGKEKRRNDAVAGDLICITGVLGDSAGGLSVILEKGYAESKKESKLIEKHYHPTPRVTEGLTLAEFEGVHAMMDISDGIASDLLHILKDSSVGAEIDADKIPISDELKTVTGKRTLQLAVEGGEDYELLFTVTPEAEEKLPVDHFVIGKIIASGDPVIVWKGSDSEFKGFSHF